MGLILLTNLPTPVSESILGNTFSKDWNSPHLQAIDERQVLTRLLGMAYAEGSPVVTLPPEFNRFKVRPLLNPAIEL